MGEPDLVQDTLANNKDEDLGSNLIQLRVTDQIKELQTILRDK